MIERLKPEITNKLYDGVELFPECKLTFITGVNMNETEKNISSSFTDELQVLYSLIKKNTQEESIDFDVALISYGGYTNLIGDYIYNNLKRRAICFGDELFAYFGIYNKSMMTKRPDVIKLFVNKNTAWVNKTK
jgi:hypothetical protein